MAVQFCFSYKFFLWYISLHGERVREREREECLVEINCGKLIKDLWKIIGQVISGSCSANTAQQYRVCRTWHFRSFIPTLVAAFLIRIVVISNRIYMINSGLNNTDKSVCVCVCVVCVCVSGDFKGKNCDVSIKWKIYEGFWAAIRCRSSPTEQSD